MKGKIKKIFYFIIKILFFISIFGFLFLILNDREYGGGAVIFIFSIWGLIEYAKWINRTFNKPPVLLEVPIGATLEEKKNIFEKYELWMFRETCKQLDLNQKTVFERNLLFESLAVHTRLLLEFFYGVKNIKHPNDILAEDFLSNVEEWRKVRVPLLTKILKEAKNKADKQSVHLSLWRFKLERDGNKGWDWHKISDDMEKIVAEFYKITKS